MEFLAPWFAVVKLKFSSKTEFFIILINNPPKNKATALQATKKIYIKIPEHHKQYQVTSTLHTRWQILETTTLTKITTVRRYHWDLYTLLT